jgi:hypothetical protein
MTVDVLCPARCSLHVGRTHGVSSGAEGGVGSPEGGRQAVGAKCDRVKVRSAGH